jgi:uroporphyrinogen decarboxylase
MNSRQRVRAALNLQEPDRVPIDLGGTGVSTMRDGAYARLKSYLGLDGRQVTGSGPSQKVRVETEVLERLQIDTRSVHTKPPHHSREIEYPDGRYVNEWGVEYYIPPSDQYAYVPVGAPLAKATLADLEAYDWPDPLDPGRTEGVREEARRLHEENKWAIVGNVDKPVIFELALAMRGFEQLLMDMMMDPAFANRLLDKLTEIQILRYERFLEETGAYLDVILFADDLGIQGGLLLSPELYCKMLKPRHKLMLEAIRRKTEARILYHSCGDVYPLIGDLIDIGVDCFNPVQVSAGEMSHTPRLKREFGKYLSFWGAIDTQHVLPYGTPDDVRAEVRRRINDLAPGGGFIVGPVHNVQDDVPPENLVAMSEETLRIGHYPLRLNAET